MEVPAELGECPTDADVVWADVQPIFEAHCTSCHGSDVTGDDRQGAPALTNFDAPEPAAASDFQTWTQIHLGRMPPPPAAGMTDEEALTVWTWLSCGGPP